MLAQAEIDRLRDRKQQLLARSETIRAHLDDACSELRHIGRHWSERLIPWRDPKTLLIIGAAVAGMILAVRRGKRLSLVAKVMAVWRLAGFLKPLWRGFRAVQALRR